MGRVVEDDERVCVSRQQRCCTHSLTSGVKLRIEVQGVGREIHALHAYMDREYCSLKASETHPPPTHCAQGMVDQRLLEWCAVRGEKIECVCLCVCVYLCRCKEGHDVISPSMIIHMTRD